MKQLAVLIAIAIFVPIRSAYAAEPCSLTTAVSFAESLYTNHPNFYQADPAPIRALLSSNLHGKILKHRECIAKESLCHIDYDPWLGAQDGEIGRPIRFSIKALGQSSVVVAMHYRFVISSSHPPKRHVVLLRLQPAPAPLCWRLDDMITPLGESLSQAYSRPW